jgi:nucleotide-binding universal stress UspA family protein
MKILVPTDFSDLSLKAIHVANRYAAIFGGKISLIYSHIPITELDEPYAIGMSSRIYQDYEEIEESLTKKLNAIVDEHVDDNYKGDVLVHIGNPAQRIVEVSEGYDIIIMSGDGG